MLRSALAATLLLLLAAVVVSIAHASVEDTSVAGLAPVDLWPYPQYAAEQGAASRHYIAVDWQSFVFQLVNGTASDEQQQQQQHDDDEQMATAAAMHHGVLSRAFERYQDVCFGAGASGVPPYRNNIFYPLPNVTVVASLSQLTLTIDDMTAALDIGVDESYNITIAAGDDAPSNATATLSARTVWGALRGLESFCQIVDWKRTPPRV